MNNDVIRHPEASLRKDGGIIVIRGNLAPEGAVIKQTAFPEKRFLHTGKARGYRTKCNLITMIYLIAGKLKFDLPT